MALTPQQIAEMDKIAGVSTPTPVNGDLDIGKRRAQEIESIAQQQVAEDATKLEQFSVGIGKGVLGTAKGLGTLGAKILKPVEKGADYISEKITGEKPNSKSLISDIYKPGTELGQKASEILEPKTTMESIGKGTEQVAEFFIPAGKVAQVEKILATGATKGVVQKLVPLLGEKAASKIGSLAELGTKVAVRAGEGAGVTAAQTGGDSDSARDAALISAVFPIAGKGIDVAKQFSKDFAPRIVNSLIKPLAKDLSYGKNPGRAVAEEGITASSLDELVTKISERKQQIGSEIGEIVSTVKDKFSDASDVVSSLDDAIASANKSPKTNSALINRLESLKSDLFDGRDLSNMSTEELFDLKSQVAELTKFTGNASDDALINKSLKKIYGALKEKVNTAAGDLKSSSGKTIRELNEKYADLSSAEIATRYRNAVAERSNIISLPSNVVGIGSALIGAIASGGAAIPALLAGAGGLALEKAASSPKVKTEVAAWLAKASPEQKSKLFKAVPALRGTIIKLFVGDDED